MPDNEEPDIAAGMAALLVVLQAYSEESRRVILSRLAEHEKMRILNQQQTTRIRYTAIPARRGLSEAYSMLDGATPLGLLAIEKIRHELGQVDQFLQTIDRYFGRA